ncbi:T9SS type A sorting domain-containing protein [Hymenobacter volaticus]|uniref:T9SS type A sorting domain-containing protein n=1 Tax=Hymenobacter volaticus TaxID=2932254 RepID=A0ABY4G8F6_9BACT|nr:T9SS type A sorting domain-containing protein [Hymenobacter volaticus]UOQ67036.1 T9SS type A sorting domain-containing protein [Hymenobacter volaticus]
MKHILLLASLLSSTLPVLAQVSLPGPPARHATINAALAPIEAQISRAEAAARPTTVVRRVGRVSTYSWDPTGAQWGPGAIDTHTFNNQGQATSVLRVDSASQIPIHRVTYNYNAANELLGYVNQDWTNGTWQNTFRIQYVYDAQGNFNSGLFQEWRNNAWATIYGSQYSFTYDGANRITEQQSANWDTALNSFVPASRYLYTYTGTDNDYNRYDYQTWTNGAWVNNSRFLNFSYATLGRPTYYETQRWNGTTWQLYSRTTYSYPATGLSHSYVLEVQVGGTWQNRNRYTTSYDALDTNLGYTQETWRNNTWALDTGLRSFVSYNANNDLSRQLIQHANLQLFVNNSKSFYSDYQTITLGNKAKAQVAEVQLSPNPTSGSATLAIGSLHSAGEVQVMVSNTLGQTVQQFTVRPQGGTARHILNVAALPAGIYSIRMVTADGAITKQLVRE